MSTASKAAFSPALSFSGDTTGRLRSFSYWESWSPAEIMALMTTRAPAGLGELKAMDM